MQIATKDTTERTSLYGKVKVGETTPVGSAEFILLREMTLRINNELMSTIGFFSHVAARSDNCDVKLALTRVVEHLYDHAGIYRALQMPMANNWVDATTYLRGLCQSIGRVKLHNYGI